MLRSSCALIASLALLCASALLTGCGSEEITCGVPFSTLPCTCVDGSAGSYICGADGVWGECTSCEEAGPDTSVTDVPQTDVGTDITTEPDTPVCEPDCDGRECGDDGCGETCGECVEGNSCVEGFCECVPNCVDRECGDDGCGGTCGECASAAHSCQGSGNVRECVLDEAGDYGNGLLRMDISPAGCSIELSLVVEDDGRVIFSGENGPNSLRCDWEYERQPLAVQLEFLGGTPTVQSPANVDAPVFIRIEWAGRGSGVEARLEGTFPFGEGTFEGRLTGLPQSVNVGGRDFRVSSGQFEFPWP